MITIIPYDDAWPEAFEREAMRIRAVLGPLALRVDHVGSTAVPGLAAKPVIDIQVSVPGLDPLVRYAEPLGRLGYRHIPVGDFDRVYPFFRRPAEWPSTHHVHLCNFGSREELRHVAFRDYLRAHAGVAAQYLELKRELAARYLGTTAESREEYSLAKSDFVEAVLAVAIGSDCQ